MNIKPQSEHLHKGRFISATKRKEIAYKDAQRRERQGKSVVRLHESFVSDHLPDASDIKTEVRAYHRETGKVPNTLLWPQSTKARYIIVYVPDVCSGCVTLRIAQSEFMGLDCRDGN